jgi:predicted DNA-binding protein (MmcQ/YjbR family)
MTMTYTEARDYLLGKPDAIEDYPFGPEVAVFKVCSKMFATLVENVGIASSNLKCDPQEALMLRDIFTDVKPGYHMNKKHWNTVQLDGDIPRGEIERMMDNSYTLVVKSLPRKVRQSLEIRYGTESVYR